MYAIVEIAGQQFKVSKDQKLFVHRLPQEEGAEVIFDKVLLLADDGQVNIGAPAISGAAVKAKILQHLKGDKVIVFKKKRRKGYRVKRGHRQLLSQIQVEDIITEGYQPAEKKETKQQAARSKAKEAAAADAVQKVAETAPEKAPEAEKAVKKTAKKAAGKADDLKKIEGIGPKIAEILVEAGIDTFEKLAQADPEAISQLLIEKGGKRYAMHNPSTWPKQAQLAAEGKWDELQALQDQLKGGRE